ncbi:PKD domain-containing protein [Pseudobacter ginsenosidimutans]|uniref:REJ domain-containing protein n=1 Tax=Pseudobacter ginsenosidimutans TaxID=661488 RepID=A0A4Q7MUC6_9BACT|nr:PKD domain-containing protein [Pseudobacter ginsenosidimutans]QEC40774.1 T9SS type A sorting domain-containing protein [Pseudobacter ginsenosidimutans]RZS72496.1 REJ domain-containing protein [Pseudobacter ginsenosidimutans]
MKNSTLMRRKLLLFLSLFMFFLSGISQQKQNWITAKNGKEIGFYEYVPTNYSANPSLKYPVIIFLHGHGERGNGRSDLKNVLLSGTPPRLIADGNPMTFTWNGKTESFIVISPQLNSEFGWWQNWYVDELLAYVQKTYRVDENRIFLTGLSMGGGGTWAYAGASLENAKKFAAIGVSCGACTNIDRCNLANANLPVWAFHAKDDKSPAPFSCTAGTIDAINACKPAVAPYFTAWETGDHWIWGRVYDPGHNEQDPNLYEWFLGQNKSLPVNKRPVINAPDVTTTSSIASAVLDASKSTDADGKIVRYSWRRISGPGGGTLSAGFSLDGKITVNSLVVEGTYVYEVKVIDDRADWTVKNITVNVVAGAPGTKKPIADAGSEFTVFYPATSTQLNGKGSYDPDGTITKWAWSQVSGPTTAGFTNGATSTPTVTNLALGTYVFKLIVTDNNNLTAEAQVTVKVSPSNVLPVAKAGADIRITLPNSTATLDARDSYDPDGEIKAYEWSYVSGPSQYNIASATAMTTTVSGLVEGTYEFKLRVWDNWYNSTNDTVKVIVSKDPAPVNNPPVASAGPDREITLPVNSASLDGSATRDPDNNITKYEWTKVNGPASHNFATGSSISTIVNDLTEGTYEFKLTVTDAGGLSSSDNVVVRVNPRPNQAPAANAGPDREITLPTQTALLDGSSSSDPDNNISSYEWVKISGPNAHTFANAAAASTNVNDLTEGTYEFQLTVKDAAGLSSSDIVVVKVNAKPIYAPVANAGPDQEITLPVSAVRLDGSGSTDADNNIKTYKWIQVSGPASPTIVNDAAAQTDVKDLTQGTYEFRLTVTDADGLSSSAIVTVKVNPKLNQSPVANAGADRNITLPASATTLDGSASSDPDNNIKTFAWSWVSGPSTYHIDNPASASTDLSGLVEGSYVFKLTVTDEDGLSSSDEVRVIVNPVLTPDNQAPTADAGSDQNITLPAATTLNGSGSKDDDGSIASWLWEWVNGPSTYNIVNKNAASTTLNGLVAGTYTFRLTVTDNGGLTASDVVTIVVNPDPNQAPVANAGNDISITLPTNSTTLDGSASTDPEGKTLTWLWEWVNGPATYTIANKNTVSTSLTGLIVGTYTFKLTVTDIGGLKSVDEIKVVVNPDPNKPPVANAGTDVTITLPVQTASLDGSLSSDPEGKTLTYLWSYVSGPNSYSFTSTNTAKTTLNGLVEGTYEFRLLVKDPGGLSSSDIVKVIVKPVPPNQLPIANAGADFSVTLPNPAIQLNGGSSTDNDGTITAWKWNLIKGPNVATITNSTTKLATVTGVIAGTYQFELVVTDNRAGIDKDTVNVIVNNPPNQAPTANAGTDITITLPVSTTTLNGSGSTDPENKPLAYLWTYVSGPTPYSFATPAAAKTVVNGLAEGTYQFQLQVTDEGGLISKDIVKVTVKQAVNKLPLANAGTDFTVTLPAPLIQLNGSASSDQDGEITTWKWSRISGPGTVTINNAQTKVANVLGALVGVHAFELVVTDNRGGIDKDTVKVTVINAPNKAPVAMAGKDTTIAVPANTAILDGTASFDPDGVITSARWIQIEGPGEAILSTPGSVATTVSGLTTGVYLFELVVTDNKGATGKDTIKVAVVNNFKYTEELALYPNPTRGQMKIRCISDTEGDAIASIIDMNGHVVKSFLIPRSQSVVIQEVSVVYLAPGVYYLHLNLANKKKMVSKFVKQ